MNVSWSGTRWQAVLPWLLFLGALLLRVWTLGWGLPYVEHPDEPSLVRIAVRMVQTGDLHPHVFYYPSLYFYLLAAASYLHGLWGIQTGLYTSLQDLPRNTFFYTTAPELYLWNRAVAALLGAAIVPALYVLGRRMYDMRTALLGALALAVSSYHIEHSQYATTDVATGLWVTLALLGMWAVAEDGGWRGYLLAGAAMGLAAGTKYNAVAAAVCLPLAHVLCWRGQSWRWRHGRWLLASGALALLVFVLSTPYAVLDWPTFLDSFRNKVTDYSPEQRSLFEGFASVGKYRRFFWREGLLPTGCLLLLLGLPLLLRRCPRQTVLLASASAVGVGLLLFFTIHFTRNVLPIFPLTMLLAAGGAVALADLIRQRWLNRLLLALLAAALLGPQLADTAWLLRYWGQPHTLVAAANDLRALPQGMRSAVDMHPVQWAGNPVVFPMSEQASERVCAHGADWYRARGFRYLVLNEDRRTSECRAQYAQLQAEGDVIASYPPRKAGLRLGPGSVVIDLGEHLAQMPFVRREAAFGGSVYLLGYELQPGPLRARITPLEGAAVQRFPSAAGMQINLYWRAREPMQQDYMLFLHVINAAGERVAQRDALLRGSDYPTSRWQPGELVIARADMPLPALPPGAYDLRIGLYDAASGARLLPTGGAGILQDGSVHLATITVE